MDQKKWQGKSDGGNSSYSQLNNIFKLVNIRFIYAILPVVVFRYLIFRSSKAKHIFRYLRYRHQFSYFKSLIGTYKNHLIFAKNFIDRLYIFSGKKYGFSIPREDVSLFEEKMKTSKPIIVIGAHVGNYEISSYLGGSAHKKMKVIVYGNEVEQLQQFRASAMKNNNIEMILIKDDMEYVLQIGESLKNGEILVLTGDRVFTGNKNYTCKFLGKEATFPMGIYYLAHLYGAKIISFFIFRDNKDFAYRLYTDELVVDDALSSKKEWAEKACEEYVKSLERYVKMYPLQWFNYYDFWG